MKLDALLFSNGVTGLCLAWAAWREFRQGKRRDARFLGGVSGIALSFSAATWLHVLDQGW